MGRTASIQSQEVSVGRDVEGLEGPYAASGTERAQLWKKAGQVLTEQNHNRTSNPTSGLSPEELEAGTRGDTRSPTFMAATR